MIDLFPAFAVGFAAILGAMVGSFLNVCVWRMPRDGISVGRPKRSHCPSCGTTISWADNIPIVSWILLGGRCRECRARISVRYLAVEALTAMLFAIVAIRFVDGTPSGWLEFVVVATLVSALVVASFIDIDLRILPDEITLGGMMLVPLAALVVPGIHASPPDRFVWTLLVEFRGLVAPIARAIPDGLSGGFGAWAIGGVLAFAGGAAGVVGFRWYWLWRHPATPNRLQDGALAGVLLAFLLPIVWSVLVEPSRASSPAVVSYASAMLGMAAGSLLVLLVGIVGSALFRKDAMGFGDVKLMGLLGGFTGWLGVLGGFAIACLLGSIVGVWRLVVVRNRYLWFGPFLAVGCLAVLLFPETLGRVLEWYLGLFG